LSLPQGQKSYEKGEAEENISEGDLTGGRGNTPSLGGGANGGRSKQREIEWSRLGKQVIHHKETFKEKDCSIYRKVKNGRQERRQLG